MRTRFIEALLAILTWQDTESLAAAAKRAMGEGRYQEAASLYRKLAAAYPKQPGLQLNVALALHSAGQYGEAEPYFERFLQANPTHPGGNLLLGIGRLKRGQACNAVAPLERARAAAPRMPEARLELASAYLSCRRAPEAERELQQLCRLTPNSAAAWYALGSAQLAQGKKKEAGEAFARLQALGDSVELHLLIAEAAQLDKRHDDALAELDKAALLATDDPRIPRLKARALWKARRYEEARPALQLLRNPAVPEAELEYELGDCIARLDGPAAALPFLRRAVELDPALIAARATLGRNLLEAGLVEESIPHLEATAPSGADPALWMALSNAYRRTGQLQKARSAAERARAFEQ